MQQRSHPCLLGSLTVPRGGWRARLGRSLIITYFADMSMNSFFRCNRGAGVSDAPVLQFTSAEHAVDPRRALDERAVMHAEVEAAYGGNPHSPLVDQSNAILVMTPSEGFVAATRTKVTEQRDVREREGEAGD